MLLMVSCQAEPGAPSWTLTHPRTGVLIGGSVENLIANYQPCSNLGLVPYRPVQLA